MKHGAASAHEAGHAVIARALGFQVVRAVAREGDSGVRTKYQLGGTAAEAASTLEKLAVVDLSGQAAECRSLRCLAWATDEANATQRALRVVLLRHGLEGCAEITEALRIEAAELMTTLRAMAAALIEMNWPIIEKLADALEGGEVLVKADIDALIGPDLAAESSPREAEGDLETLIPEFPKWDRK
jgi:hypothetical protein